MKNKYTAFFFANGNIAVTNKTGEQVPELQRKSTVVLFAEFLEAQGYNPEDFLLELPSGKARLFKTDNGWNWRF